MDSNIQDDKTVISSLRAVLIEQERTLREYEGHKYFFNSYKDLKQIFHAMISNGYIDSYFTAFFAGSDLPVKMATEKLNYKDVSIGLNKYNPLRIYRAYQLKRKKFDKLTRMLKSGHKAEAEKLIMETFNSRSERGDAMLQLARESADPAEKVRYAHLAWLADSAPYRLKYWAFRLFDNGEYDKAYFLLSITPEEIIRTASEKIYQKKIIDKFREIHREKFKNLVTDIFNQYAK